MTQGSDQDRKDVQTSFFVVFLGTGKRFFGRFHPRSGSWELSKPKLDSPHHRATLQAFSKLSVCAQQQLKKKKVLLRKKTKPLGQVESIWKTPSCYIEWFILKKSLELVAREHTLVATEQRKCSGLCRVLMRRRLPPFLRRLFLSYLLQLHAQCSARQEIPKAGRENKQELLKVILKTRLGNVSPQNDCVLRELSFYQALLQIFSWETQFRGGRR